MTEIDRPEATSLERLAALILAALAPVVGFWLLIYRVDDPIGGYLGFNEAWYALAARDVLAGHVIPVEATGQLAQLFPLTSWLVAAVMALTNDGEAALRLVPLLAGTAVAALTTRLAWRTAGPWPGVVAGWALVATPLWAVVSRNLQSEAVFVALALSALELGAGSSRARRWGAGILLGLALLAKPFTVILVAAVAVALTWQRRSLGWVREAPPVALPALLIPASYVALYLASRPEALALQRTAGAKALALPDLAVLGVLGREGLYSLGPTIVILVVAGLVAALVHRDQAARLSLSAVALFALFYLFVHYHSYYPYTILPALAVLAGLPARRSRLYVAGALPLVMIGLVATVATLGAVKYGRSELRTAARWAASLEERPVFFLTDSAYGAIWPILTWYGDATVWSPSTAPVDAGGCFDLPYDEGIFVLPPRPSGTSLARTWLVQRMKPIVAGVEIDVTPRSPHLFAWQDVEARRVGNLAYFDLVDAPPTGVLHVERLAPDARICPTPEGLTIRVTGPHHD